MRTSPVPLPLERASRVLAAAQLEARRLSVPAAAVVILDADGAVRLAAREDGQGSFSIDIAHAKAATALGFRRSTKDVTEIFSTPQVVAGLAAVLDGRFLPLAGAVLIPGPNGIEGAIGVAGGRPETDHNIATAGAGAAGLDDQDEG